MCAVQLLRVSVHERISAAAEDFLLQLEKTEEAAEIPALRALLTERLTAAAEEIVGLFEETVAEYEDRVERSEREICRQRKLLDAVLKPEVKLHRADVQLLLDPPEQQEWSSSLDQEDPELPHIKEEQEELWSSQEGEQLGGLEEAQIKFTPVPVKSEEEEDEEEKPQSSQLHQRPTEADGEDSGGPEPARNSDPGPDSQPLSEDRASDLCVAEIEVSCEDWEETTDPPSGSYEQTVSDEKLSSLDKPFSCSECGKKFARTGFLETHIRTHTGTHTGPRPFSCSVCGKKYTIYRYLVRHMTVHTGQRPHSCSVCSKRLVQQLGVECHRCDKSECNQKLCYSHNLRGVTTPLQGLFSCSVCGRRFTQRGYLMQHMDRHTGKIRFRCCVCDKRFTWRHELKSHTCAGGQGEAERDGEPEPAAPTGDESRGSDSDNKTSDSEPEVREDEWTETSEPQSGSGQDVPAGDAGSSTDRKSFICTNCGKMLCGEENLKTHLRTHSGETRFGCSFCKKGLPQRENLSSHLSVHMEDKRFLYCICGKRFAWRYDLKNHRCDNDSPPSSASKPHTEVGADDDGNDTNEPRLTSDSQETAEVLEGDTEERPFGCSRCAKRFRRKKNLQEHMRIHTGERPYGCSVCLKYFSCSGSLRKHLRIHTGEKPFSCSVCGNRFTESGHLKVHMRTHTGEKPFSCAVCGKSFTWRQSFNNHMKYHVRVGRCSSA